MTNDSLSLSLALKRLNTIPISNHHNISEIQKQTVADDTLDLIEISFDQIGVFYQTKVGVDYIVFFIGQKMSIVSHSYVPGTAHIGDPFCDIVDRKRQHFNRNFERPRVYQPSLMNPR